MRDVVGFEGLYRVDEYGNVFSLHQRTVKRNPSGLVKEYRNMRGYSYIHACRKGKTKILPVHRIVAFAYIGQPPIGKGQVDHIDGNKQNNHVSNLRWVTPKENINYAWKKGLYKRRTGVDNNYSRLVESDIIRIRDLADCGNKDMEISKIIGVSRSHVSRIRRGKAWTHI